MCLPNIEEESFHLNNIFHNFEDDDSDNDTVDIVQELIPWQLCFYTNPLKFEAGFLAATDQTIIDLYANEFPNTVFSVLRLGCDYTVFKKADRIEIEYGATAISVDPDTFIHLFGKYYTERESSTIMRYCIRCMRENFTEDRNEIDVYCYHNYIDNVFIHTEVFSGITNYKYWCAICDRFLFDVEYNTDYADIDSCSACSDLVPYDPKYMDNDPTVYETHFQLRRTPLSIPLVQSGWPL